MFDRFMVRLIMLITMGPADPATVAKCKDWKKVQAFGRVISEMQGECLAARPGLRLRSFLRVKTALW
ncbi:MAG: hypothetical protein FIA96_10955 [Betaproteobacteria bacterium]|nr:hypothetical protein [Betaproteobacteria bacterium]